jgi:hypothetical protein
MPPRKKTDAKGAAKPRMVALKENPAHMPEEEWDVECACNVVVMAD